MDRSSTASLGSLGFAGGSVRKGFLRPGTSTIPEMTLRWAAPLAPGSPDWEAAPSGLCWHMGAFADCTDFHFLG